MHRLCRPVPFRPAVPIASNPCRFTALFRSPRAATEVLLGRWPSSLSISQPAAGLIEEGLWREGFIVLPLPPAKPLDLRWLN